jgi:hypothetical protein
MADSESEVVADRTIAGAREGQANRRSMVLPDFFTGATDQR